jgi:succinyl-diaminopimelate desuccinylase
MMTPISPLHPGNLLRLLRELVRFPTVNPPGGEEPAARFVERELRAIGCETVVVPYVEGDGETGRRGDRETEHRGQELGRAHVVGRLRGSGERPGLMLSGHLDVVPPGAVPWSHDPFAAEVADGWLYGRGACDMKAGVAAMIAAAAEIAHAGDRLRGDLVICASADEEAGCRGADALVGESLFEGLGAVLIGEPSDLGVFVAEKGAFWLEVTVTGKTAHASTPHFGANAIAAMAEFLTRLPAAALGGAKADPQLGVPTVSIGTIAGGVKINVVPDTCTATLDFRTVPGQNHAEIRERVEAELRAVLEGRPHTAYTIETLIDRAPVSCPPDTPLAAATARAVRAVTGREITPGGVPYFTEACVFVPALGLPMAICGPGDPRLAHQPDEHVELAQVEQAARIYVQVIRELLAED